MANQIVVSAGAKVRNLDGVLTGTSGVVNSLPINASNGIPQLDVNGKILVSQLPNSVMEYQGVWNANTNTPTLTNGGAFNQGDVYLCNVAGTTNFGAGPISFIVGDQAIYSGTIWQKAGGATGTVTSVAITESGDSLNITGSPITTSGTINIGFNGTNLQYVNGAGNLTTFPTLITSIGLSMPSAFSVSNSPLTANGTIAVTGAGTTAQYIRGDGSLATFPTIATEAQRLITEVYNETGATLTKGTVVYINGGHGNLPTITKAIATGDATSAQTYGIVQTDITNMNNGYVVVIGSLGDLDTQAYANGTQLYLSSTTAGAWTSTKQYAPAHLVYVGIVVRSHPTQGVVEVRIQNGFEMDELHNVSAQSPLNNQGLFYNTSTSLWENKSIATALGYTPANDASVVHNTGNETIGGTKTFSDATKNNGGIFLQNASSSSLAGYMNLGGLTNGVKFTSGGGVSNTFTLPSATGYTFTFPNATGTLALTSDLTGGTVTSVAALTIGTTGTDVTSTVANSTTTPVITLNVPTASATNRGALSSTDWTTFNSKQGTITLTTTGTSGAATFSANTLNIPNYGSALSGYLPLTGGTLTGQLNGTTIVLSSTLQTNFLAIGGTNYPNVALTFKGTVNGNNDSWGSYQGGLTLAPIVNSSLAVGYQAGGTINTGTYTGLSYRGFYQENLQANTGTGTLATAYGIYIDSLTRATNNYSAYFAQNVGIGTTTPATRLDISYADTSYNAGITVKNTTNSVGAQSRINISDSANNFLALIKNPSAASSGSALIATSSTEDLVLGVNYQDYIHIYNGGNIGLSTTSNGGYKLDVNGTGRFSGITTFGSTGGSGLRVYGGSGTNQWDIYLNGGNLRFSDNTGTGSIVFDRPLSGTSAIFSSSVQAGNNFVAKGTLQGYSGGGMFMSYESYGGRLESYDYSTSAWKNIAIAPNGGNVGIGTSSPVNLLQIATGVNQDDTVGTVQTHYNGTNVNFNSGYTSKNYNGTSQFMQWSYFGVRLGSRILTNSGQGQVIFTYGADAEGMRMASGGELLIANSSGTQATGYGTNRLVVNGGIYATSSIAAVVASDIDMLAFVNTGATYSKACVVASMTATGGTGSYFFYGQQSTSTAAIKIFSNGNIQNTNNSYGAISDARLKENIKDATPKLDDLMKVKVRNYNLKGESNKQLGVISQELEAIFPNMIEESTNMGENMKIKGVKYSVFVPMLIKAVQELKAEIEILKNK